MTRSPDAVLLTLCATHLGPIRDSTFCGHDHAESQVWHVQSDHARAFLKVHRRPRKFRQERDAYHNVLLHIATPTLQPRLIATHDTAPRALLIEALPGHTLDALSPTLAEQRSCFEQAGRWLRGLHSVPHTDSDPMPLEGALARRMEGWSARARDHIEPEVLDAITRRFDPEVFRGASRVWCHRDFQPRNWMYDAPAERLGVIDFEHAHPDCPWIDLVKLADDAWLREPSLEDAFFRGYGRPLEPAERAQLDQLMLLHAVATVAWSVEHNDAVYRAHGEALVKRLI